MSDHLAPLVLGSDLPGRPVVAIDCGDDIAEIKDVVFDAVSHRLVGFTLNKRGWFRGTLKATLPQSAVRAIGPVAVMVAGSDDLVDRSESPDTLDVATNAVTIMGTRVLSSSGDELGEITDIVLETGPTPLATGYRVSTGDDSVFVPISAQLALSDNNLVLPANATDFVRNDLSGFGAAVTEYRRMLEASQ